MQDLSRRMSLFEPDSELSKINAGAGAHPVPVSPEMMEVVGRALEISSMSGGAFDATVGSVEAVWGDIQHGGAVGRIPDEGTLHQALAKVGYPGVRRDPEARTVFLEREGARLDLGGIAKGYIVDQGVQGLRAQGMDCVMINAGGDIRASGCGGAPVWKVGLQDPFEKGRLLGVFLVRDRAVVTSGSYERYFENEQGRFSHILDPHTGRPAAGPVSVTVLADRADIADGLATAFMVTGREKGMALLRRLGSVEAVFVEADGSIWMDGRLRDRFEPGPLPEKMTIRYYSAAEEPVRAGEPPSR